MRLYQNLVSDAMVGTCRKVGGRPTLVLADANNDFFETVDVTVVLSADARTVTSLVAEFGEDSEGVTRRITAPDGTGTSATLAVSGGTYKVTGDARMREGGATVGTTVPYTVTVKCAGRDW